MGLLLAATHYNECGIGESPPGCIPNRNYGLDGLNFSEKFWAGILGLSIMIFSFSNTVVPEIQVLTQSSTFPYDYMVSFNPILIKHQFFF